MLESPLSLPAPDLSPPLVIPVSLLNRLARERLESAFPLCWVAGEISNLSRAVSGHLYFSLKDGAAQVRCVMFRHRAQLLGWWPEDGQRIEARVLVTLYEARGDFQLNVETARKAGLGQLYEQFLRLKEKLASEGLFAEENKKPLPSFPKRIGIISSLRAAALKDVLTTFCRRAPQVGLVIYPAAVQGEQAAGQIAQAIGVAGERGECDLLIVCRGGGSLEDLWAFNDEALARAIRNSRLPVMTGIGHETDWTLADFAADRRAPTPTAAAELAAPERSALTAALVGLRLALTRRMRELIDRRSQQLDGLAQRLPPPARWLAWQRENLRNLHDRLAAGLARTSAGQRTALTRLTRRFLLARPSVAPQRRRLDACQQGLRDGWRKTGGERSRDLARLAASLQHLNPGAVLERGYSLVMDAQGNIVRDSRALEPKQAIVVNFHVGRVEATVTRGLGVYRTGWVEAKNGGKMPDRRRFSRVSSE